MAKGKLPNNPIVASLIKDLVVLSNKHDSKIWRVVSKKLQRSRRQRIGVNISKINRYVKSDEIAVVPDKVLSAGKLDRAITVAAMSFSESAINKIVEAKGRAITIRELVAENPKGTKVRIIV